MGRLKNFLPWLFDKDKKPLYIDANGNLVQGDAFTLKKADGRPAHLSAMPTGWRDTMVKYGRNTTYLGIFRDFTVPLTFAVDGAKIVQNLMWGTRGIEAQLYFALSKLDRYEVGVNYKPWYRGDLDFSTFKQRPNRGEVEINVMEGGITKYLKAYEDTTYEIPIGTDAQAVNVYMDGRSFDNNLEYLIYDQPASPNTIILPGIGLVNQEGTSRGIEALDQQYATTGVLFPNELHFFQSLSETFVANLTGTISVNRINPGNHGIGLKFRKRNELTGTTTDYVIVNQFQPPGVYNYNYNLNIPFTPGDKLYLWQDTYTDSQMTYKVTGGSFLMKYLFKFQPTICKALRGDYLFQQIVLKMSKGTCTATSNFLSNFRKLVFTSGTALRGNPNSTIKITLKEFFRTCKPFGTAMGAKNDTLIIEKLDNFFQKVDIANLGEVDEMSVDIAQDMIYNTINVGYRNTTYDNVNGLDEYNVTQGYTTDITKISKVLDLVSPCRADMTGIELQRLNLTGKTSTDSSSDNEPFILNITENPETLLGVSAYRLNRPAYSAVFGVTRPAEAFNIEFSPHRRLMDYMPYINSMADLQTGTNVTYQTGEKNSELATISPAGQPYQQIVEKANETISNAPKLFKPYYFTFKTQVPFNFMQTMSSNPYGRIKFTYKGDTWYGYMVDGGVKPATNDAQEWKLLACVENDMTKLI